MLQLRNRIASLTIGSFTFWGVTAQLNVRIPLTREVDNFATEALDNWKVAGLSIAGYGFAALPDKSVTPETLWYTASTTKAQTSPTLAHLIDSGNYPALANAHDKAYEGLVKGKKAKPKDIVHNLRNLPLTTEPWVKYSYTSLTYTTISHVIKIITGKWLRDVLKELIWAPLDMDSTLFDLQDASHAPNQLASGYYWDTKEGKYGEVPFMNVTELSGAGEIFSNVLDFAKWVKCLLHEAAPFSKEVHRDIKSSRMIEHTQLDGPSDMVTYGLGWKGHVMYSHSGGVHAYGAQVYWLPSIRYGVVAFANTALTSNAVEEILAWNLIQDRLKIPENERSDVKSKCKKMKELDPPADEAVGILYPERPQPPLPPTLNITELEGISYDPGYGRITLREEPHPGGSGEKAFVADRHDVTWKHQMRLHHVSGDYWIIYLPVLENPGYIVEFVAGEFKIGSNGKVAGLQGGTKRQLLAVISRNVAC
ncbi:hypothetical protein FOC4_g10002981 [Fusarium odoratissimum]|uniref:Beta-lactamase-related domain-containing protein n=3 Tax=Fusarium oxysporum species complex TaxID=171631 RepID=N1S736_FUSC4|nr:hypothetical protein FOC4_g10002981 [Fusarium odoratissimum]